MGAGSMGQAPAYAGYPTMNSMSALARFPWVRACVTAIATDLGGLPIVIVDRDRTGKMSEVPGHRALYYFEHPNTRQTGREWRNQLYLDRVLSGNAYVHCPGGVDSMGPMIRVHPASITPVVDEQGFKTAFQNLKTGDTYSLEEVMHIADVSWSDQPNQVIGESAIRTLHDDLVTSRAAKEHAANAAKRGRAEWLLTPTKEEILGQGEIDRIQQSWEEQLRSGNSAVVVGASLLAQPLSFNLRDIEYSELQTGCRDATLAVFGVPGVRVSLPGANYGTAKTQMRTYWEYLQSLAAQFDDQFSRRTEKIGALVRHDFSKVEALQASYGERLDRVKNWVELGAEPYNAALSEGFRNPPLAVDAVPRAYLTPASEKQPDEPRETRSLQADIARYLEGASARFERALRFSDDPASVVASLEPLEASHLSRALEAHLGHADAYTASQALARALSDQVIAHRIELEAEGLEAGPMRSLPCFSADYAADLATYLQHREAL